MTNRQQHMGEAGGTARPRRRDTLRARAERVLRKTRLDIAALAPQDVQRLFHELQVHQIELEMQNEQLRATARELEDSREQYHSLYEEAPVGYLGLSPAGTIERANLAASTLLAVNRRDLLGKSMLAFVEDGDLRTLNEHLRLAQKMGTATCELRLNAPKRNGSYARLETSCRPERGAGYRTVLTDVSARKKAEVALQALNRDLEERVAARTAELEQRNDELEHEIVGRMEGERERGRLEMRLRQAERLEGLGLLAGGIAHDFNNLLVGVISNADILLDRERTPSQIREGLLLIRQAGLSAADLTRQMLIYAGHGRVRLSAVDLEKLTTRALGLMRARVPPGVELHVKFAQALPAINADKSQVQQVITNLVTNAIEAMSDACGQIVMQANLEELTAARLALYTHRNDVEPGAFIVLRVDDTGKGMDQGTLDRIFDPFYTTKFSGRGLGLACVLGIVRGHRAGLCVRSHPGEGTSFEIAWPISATSAVAQPSPPVAARKSWTASGRALVIDDNSDVRSTVACLLGHLGFDVTEAAGADEGIDLFRSAVPGFVLAVVDQTMPGRSGTETIAALHDLAPKLPAVLMSGYPAKSLVLTNDHVTFLQKPMTVDQLQDAIRKVLEERS